MPRLARKDYDTCYFHIIVQGINKEYIFNKDEYIKYYLKLLYKHKEEYNINIIAYCIMNNHAHVLIKIKSVIEMANYMKIINTKYAMYYNKKEQRVGYVFRDRYKSQPIVKEEQLIKCIDYIHNNPVKAKIVVRQEQYLYSSYHEYVKKKIKIIKDEEISENIFIDIEDDKTEITELIHDFQIKSNKTLEDIKKEKYLLNLIVIELKNKTRASNREIARALGKDRDTINRIIRQNAPSLLAGNVGGELGTKRKR